ncbi:unnamed protein product [Paramecium sonneborni]|uniref:Uncharacterized protein n=1 Tax=Paramecium sonneborni TaxID=65129 RepID=A0A8S1N8K4_9CILI|nr:unnamed protein product [Paramecium sonneborni]
MGCNPSRISIHEPIIFEDKGKIKRNSNQLTEIQKNIEKHLKSQFGTQRTPTTASPNTVIPSNRSSRITDQYIEMTKSTIIFQIDKTSQAIQRRSLQ